MSNKKIKLAIDKLESGAIDESKKILKKIFNTEPSNFESSLLLGVISGIQNDHLEARSFFEKSVKINPKNALAQFNYAKSLHECGEYQASLPHHMAATKLSPNNPEIWINFGRTLHTLGKQLEAIRCFEQALIIDENLSDAFNNKGSCLHQLKKYSEAIECFDLAMKSKKTPEILMNKALALHEMKEYGQAINSYKEALSYKNDYPEAWYSYAKTLIQINELNESFKCVEKALLIRPSYYEALILKGIIYLESKKYVEALEYFESILVTEGNSIEVLNNKGLAQYYLKFYEPALKSLERSIEIKPTKEAWNYRGLILSEVGDLEGAEFSYLSAIKLDYKYADSHFNLGCLLLGSAKFQRGWQEFEWRFFTKKYGANGTKFSKPKWSGLNSAASLLVWSEHGVGDQILYSSMFDCLTKYKSKIIIQMDKRLVSTYQKNYSQFIFLDTNEVIKENEYDEQISMGGLGEYFRIKSESFEKIALISPTGKLQLQVLNYLTHNNKKIRCGISWRSTNGEIGEEKSIKLDNFRDIFNLSNIDYINLQYGDVYKEIEILHNQESVNNRIVTLPSIDLFNDLEELFKVVDVCDVIVTTSNTTAHIAGILGKKVLLLLPFSRGKLWYWTVKEDGYSHWYPSIKIISQKAPNDWTSPLAEVMVLLKELNDR